MEDGRVSHSWCMYVVGHGYGGFGEGRVEVVDGMHVGQNQVGWWHVWRCGSTSRVRGDTLMLPDNNAVQMRTSRYGRVGIDRSSWKGKTSWNTVLHEMAPVPCPRSRLATLHGATRTHVVGVSTVVSLISR